MQTHVRVVIAVVEKIVQQGGFVIVSDTPSYRESYYGHIRRKVNTNVLITSIFLLITVLKPNHPWAIADDAMIKLTFDDKDVSYPELLK